MSIPDGWKERPIIECEEHVHSDSGVEYVTERVYRSSGICPPECEVKFTRNANGLRTVIVPEVCDESGDCEACEDK